MTTREIGTPYKSNPTLTQFKRTMDREGVTCTTYTGGTEFKAFFRIKDDNENQKETTVLYYDVNAPVRPGTLICYGYGVFLALNRETVENGVYYKSTLVKCNGTYTDNDNYTFGSIPFYTDNMKSSVAIGNQVISMLNGNIEFITEDNSISRKIDINRKFNEFGRSFEVCNRYCIDGITHIIAEVCADQKPSITYSIIIDGIPTSAMIDDAFTLSATGYINGAITSNATFEWSSSDNTIATIDGNGNVHLLKDGAVTFTVHWVEFNVDKISNTLSVGGDIVPSGYTATLTYTGGAVLKVGTNYKTITAHIFESSGTELTELTETWSFEVVYDFPKEITTSQTGNKFKIKVSDNYDLIGTSLILKASESTHDITVSETFEIAGYL